jgi:SAM-dependent methyltransferase
MMSTSVSSNYRQLAPDEIDRVAAECAKAWQSPEIPMRQYELAVKPELDKYRKGQPVAPYDALVKCLRQIPLKFSGSRSRLLDVGASSGYYREVLRQSGYYMQYTGVDYSPAFKKLADRLYQGIDFDVADATALPFHDDTYEIVLSGACIMHLANYPKAIQEAARVSRRYVILHRTPVTNGQPTQYWLKEAYGVPCLEIWFNEYELERLCTAAGLDLLWQGDVNSNHKSYLLRKPEGLNHVQV